MLIRATFYQLHEAVKCYPGSSEKSWDTFYFILENTSYEAARRDVKCAELPHLADHISPPLRAGGSTSSLIPQDPWCMSNLVWRATQLSIIHQICLLKGNFLGSLPTLSPSPVQQFRQRIWIHRRRGCWVETSYDAGTINKIRSCCITISPSCLSAYPKIPSPNASGIIKPRKSYISE
jgi:hypothetical protein